MNNRNDSACDNISQLKLLEEVLKCRRHPHGCKFNELPEKTILPISYLKN